MDKARIAELKALAQARFAQLQAAKAAQAAIKPAVTQPPTVQLPATKPEVDTSSVPPTHQTDLHLHNLAAGITLNEKQKEAVSLIASGQSCCLIGAAGTGKTTTVNAAVKALLESHRVPILAEDTKRLSKGTPGIVGIAFTRRAAANLRAQVPAQLANNVMTLHALLEFEPVEVQVMDSEGNTRNSIRFEPQRHAANPLPTTLSTIIVDESSMLSVELFKLLLAALTHPVQFIFIGDIQQLAPVFGEAILGFKLLELPVIELTQVYRQALESPIIRLAHRVLEGKQIPPPELSSHWQFPGQLTIARWPANTSPERAENIAVAYLTDRLKAGTYDPENDMVLIPFNKHFGTYRMGRRSAQMLDERAEALGNPREIIEVIAGYTRHYLAVGDRMLYDNDEVVIKGIFPNMAYHGTLKPRHAKFSRFGTILDVDGTIEDEEDWLEKSAAEIANAAEEGVTDEASHVIHLDYGDGELVPIRSRGQINKLAFAYCTTIHKAQGLQAPRVFLLAHKQHAVMVCRELLYTGITRAQKELTVLCDPTTFMGGIIKQQIKGTTLAEKAAYFQGKRAQYEEKLNK
jgi:exodeoxyribonuclease V alpha subunit